MWIRSHNLKEKRLNLVTQNKGKKERKIQKIKTLGSVTSLGRTSPQVKRASIEPKSPLFKDFSQE